MNRRNILLVEDNDDARQALAALLEHHGYEVRSAANGALALDEARRQPPNLMITDLGLPELSGLEVVQQFRELPALADVPVIVVSGHHDIQERILGFDLGADDFLPKPVTWTSCSPEYDGSYSVRIESASLHGRAWSTRVDWRAQSAWHRELLFAAAQGACTPRGRDRGGDAGRPQRLQEYQ